MLSSLLYHYPCLAEMYYLVVHPTIRLKCGASRCCSCNPPSLLIVIQSAHWPVTRSTCLVDLSEVLKLVVIVCIIYSRDLKTELCTHSFIGLEHP